MVPCRTGNYTRKVSYGGETQWGYVVQETIREKFPMEVKHDDAMSDRKLYANSFLWR